MEWRLNHVGQMAQSVQDYSLKGKNNSMKKVVAIILGVNIFSSLGETCFMYPSFISCFVYTIIYLTYACESIGSNNTIRKIKKDIY